MFFRNAIWLKVNGVEGSISAAKRSFEVNSAVIMAVRVSHFEKFFEF
jgi:hypothetical protein